MKDESHPNPLCVFIHPSAFITHPSVYCRSGNLHDLAPFDDFAVQISAELRGRHRDGLDAVACEPLRDIRLAHQAVDLAVELRDDFARCRRRRKRAIPAARLEAGYRLSLIHISEPT